MREFPKFPGIILEVLGIKIIVFKGLHWVPLFRETTTCHQPDFAPTNWDKRRG